MQSKIQNPKSKIDNALHPTPDTRYPTFGGEMELSSAQLHALTEAGEGRSLPYERTTTSGRTAIKLILQSLQKGESRKALLPDYLCPSVLQPFREAGYEVHFYRMQPDLRIDLDHLMHLMDQVDPDVLLFINYFGFPVGAQEAQTLIRLKARCQVIEDCVHGSLIEPNDPVVGKIGHFAITSFRKYLPVPDGGLVINRSGIDLQPLPPAEGTLIQDRLLGKMMRATYFQTDQPLPALEPLYLALFAMAEDALDAEVPMRSMSQISTSLMKGIDPAEAMQRRRSNYAYLLREFAEDANLRSIGTPLWELLPPGVSPLIFPLCVQAERRDMLRHELAQRRVFCPIHWQLPAEICEEDHPEAHRLSRRMLGLPIDQRYDVSDMEALLSRLKAAWQCVTSSPEHLAA